MLLLSRLNIENLRRCLESSQLHKNASLYFEEPCTKIEQDISLIIVWFFYLLFHNLFTFLPPGILCILKFTKCVYTFYRNILLNRLKNLFLKFKAKKLSYYVFIFRETFVLANAKNYS